MLGQRLIAINHIQNKRFVHLIYAPTHTRSLSPVYWSPAPAATNHHSFKYHSISDTHRPVYGSLPWTVTDSLMLLTCMYLPFDLQTYLQCYSSESSTLIPLVPGPLSTSKPARIQTVNIQLSSQELVTVFILTCHYSPRSPSPAIQ